MKIFVFGDSDEADKQRALQDAQRFGGVGDRDAVAERQEAVPTPEPVEAVPVLQEAPSSAAALSVTAMLDAGLSVADVRGILDAEERRRAALEADRARRRAALLLSEAERQRLARMDAERQRLAPLLANCECEIQEAVAQFLDQRDALLVLAAELNSLDVRHARLHGALVDVTAHAIGEFPQRKRPFAWADAHQVTLDQLRRAVVD